MEVLVFIIVAHQITRIVNESDLFYDLIEKTSGWVYNFLRCSDCFGSWVGFIMGAIFSPISLYVDLPVYIDIFACGMLASGGISIINKIE